MSLSSPQQANARPPNLNRRGFFWLLVGRAIGGSGARILTALAAVTLAAAVAAALGNLQLSLRSKLEKQLQAFGPNILITASRGSLLKRAALENTCKSLSASYYPYSGDAPWIVARQDDPGLIHAVRAQHRAMNLVGPQVMRSWWRVRGAWVNGPGQVLMGERVAGALGVGPGAEVLASDARGKPQLWRVAGIISAGSDEDGQFFTPLEFSNSASVDGAEVRVSGDEAKVAAAAETLRSALPAARVRVLQRVARADTLILGRIGEVFGLLGLVIILASGLCVSTTFSTMVSQRSVEIGLQKALGATDSEVVALFWGEALVLGSAGAVAGFVIGSGFAAWIGQSVFQSAVAPRLAAIPLVGVAAIGMTLLAAIPSAKRIARLEPVLSLKGSAK